MNPVGLRSRRTVILTLQRQFHEHTSRSVLKRQNPTGLSEKGAAEFAEVSL